MAPVALVEFTLHRPVMTWWNVLVVFGLVSSPPDLAVETYTLPSNGLEVILSHDPTLLLVAVNVWYHVGAANEPPRRTGFAHLFEHLMFRGSAHVGSNEHVRLLESVGAMNVNGTTSFDRTNFFETVPSNQLELALWLESDRMGFLLESLTEEKLDNQRQIVMNERRQTLEERPYGPSSEAFFKALFPKGHPYHGYLIGSMDDIQSVTLQDAKQFYRRFYAPGNATLSIVGDFDPKTVRKMIETYFGTLPPRPVPPEREIITPPISRETRLSVREPVPLPRIQMGWHSDTSYGPDDATADMLAVVLGQGKSSRLHSRLVEEKELAASVYAAQQSLQLRSVFSISATARPGVSAEQLESELEATVEALKRTPPSNEEMERARNQLTTNAVTALQGLGSRADRLNRYNHYMGDPDGLQRDLARYQSVSAEDVHDLAIRLLTRRRRVVVTTVPNSR